MFLSRYAIFALIDPSDASKIRKEQEKLTYITGNDLALRFPVHITLRGRFLAPKSSIVDKFKEITRDELGKVKNVLLTKPVYIKPDLVWLEIENSSLGYNHIFNFHKFFEKFTEVYQVFDEVSESHKKENFRPHITLGWGVTQNIWKDLYLPISTGSICSNISTIALVKYPKKWKKEGFINVISQILINEE